MSSTRTTPACRRRENHLRRTSRVRPARAPRRRILGRDVVHVEERVGPVDEPGRREADVGERRGRLLRQAHDASIHDSQRRGQRVGARRLRAPEEPRREVRAAGALDDLPPLDLVEAAERRTALSLLLVVVRLDARRGSSQPHDAGRVPGAVDQGRRRAEVPRDDGGASERVRRGTESGKRAERVVAAQARHVAVAGDDARQAPAPRRARERVAERARRLGQLVEHEGPVRRRPRRRVRRRRRARGDEGRDRRAHFVVVVESWPPTLARTAPQTLPSPRGCARDARYEPLRALARAARLPSSASSC